MYNNSHYWKEKEQRKETAKAHHELMKETLGADTIYSSYRTKCYEADKLCKPARVRLMATDTVSALFKVHIGTFTSCVLNFASYKHAGGMFIEGSMAQEESLCHASNLYEILLKHQNYYDYNNQHLNRGLYLDRALYSKEVSFIQGDTILKADVITCAAPNFKAASKCGVLEDENVRVLEERAKFVVEMALKNNVDNLILGAWGCGVFGQNPYDVAEAFAKAIKPHTREFKDIVFAVPKDFHSENYVAFAEVLPKYFGEYFSVKD